jgi:hypothetical protein
MKGKGDAIFRADDADGDSNSTTDGHGLTRIGGMVYAKLANGRETESRNGLKKRALPE